MPDMKRILTTGSLLLATASLASGEVFEAFEGDGFGNWEVDGKAFGMAPAIGSAPESEVVFHGYSDSSLACSTHGGSQAKGTLTSPEFEVTSDFIIFLIAGGNEPGKTAVQLLQHGKVVREQTGNRSLTLQESAIDVKKFKGQKVRLRLVDEADGEWGFIAADHFQFDNWPKPKFPPQNVEPEAESAVASGIPGLKIPAGTQALVVADHQTHGIYSPTALAFDEQGALYIAETHRFRHGIEDNRSRLYWLLEDAAARTVEDRGKMYERWSEKFAPGYLTEKSEVIRRLTAQDADGRFTAANIYADGFNDPLDGTAAGVFAYEGSVYFSCIPKIYRLADSDGDGTADVRDVIEDGMGVRVSFSGHDLNGFKLGPDGRIYCSIGDRGFHFTTADGTSYDYPNQGAVFRFDPDGSNFEVIHYGLRNPKELAFDAHGNLFSVDNNSDQGDKARLVYIVDGADSGWRMGHQLMNSFHRQIGMEKRPPNMWMQERWWEPGSDLHPASIVPPVANITSGPSGLAYHPGTGYRNEDAGRFLVCDYRGSAANSGVWSFAVEPSGAGMAMKNAELEITGVCATDVTFSWDGDLYISDFIVGWESHAAGRVIKVSADKPHLAKQAKEVAALVAKGFTSLTAGELEPLLGHPDQRVRLRAQIALTRLDDGIEILCKVAANGDGLNRLHGVWGLGIIARRGAAAMPDEKQSRLNATRIQRAAEMLVGLLDGADPEKRAQIIKVLGDAGVREAVPFAKLITDPAPRVRMFAAIAAGKVGATEALSAVETMLAENADADAYLRHAGAYAFSNLATADALVAQSRRAASPSVRLAAVVALGHLKHAGAAEFLNDKAPRVVDEAIRVIHDQRIDGGRPQVAAILDAVDGRSFSDFMWRRVVNCAFRVGGKRNAARLVQAALEPKLPLVVRQEAVRLLGMWSKPDPIDASTGTYDALAERDPGEVAAVVKGHIGELLEADPSLLEGVILMFGKVHADLSEVPVAQLNTMMGDTAVPVAARAAMLPRWVEIAGEKARPTLVGLIDDPADELSLAAIDILLEWKHDGMTEVLIQQTHSEHPDRVRNAWSKLAAIPQLEVAATFANGVFQLANALGKHPAALEILAGARTRDEALVHIALQQYDQLVAASSDPLAAHYPTLLGGNTKLGLEDFLSHPAAQCMRCHKAGSRGSGDAGPNLKGISKSLTREQLLEALILPAARVAPGYGIVTLTLKDGTITGGVLYESSEEMVEIDVAGKRQRIPRTEIQTMAAPVSAMPPMSALLKPEEIRDIVEWLSGL